MSFQNICPSRLRLVAHEQVWGTGVRPIQFTGSHSRPIIIHLQECRSHQNIISLVPSQSRVQTCPRVFLRLLER